MIQVLQATAFKLVVSYIALKVGTGSAGTSNVGNLLVSVFSGAIFVFAVGFSSQMVLIRG